MGKGHNLKGEDFCNTIMQCKSLMRAGSGLLVHRRVFERHPDLRLRDVVTAWNEAIMSAPRIEKNPDEYVSLGFDSNGRLIEMAAARSAEGVWVIFHAMTPPSERTYREFGIAR